MEEAPRNTKSASGISAKDELLWAGGAGGLCHCVRVFGFEAGEFFADGLNDEGGAALARAGFEGELGDGAVDAKGHQLSRPR